MTALAAYRSAFALAAHGLTADTATHTDLDAAADHAGVDRPDGPDERHLVREALARITPQETL